MGTISHVVYSRHYDVPTDTSRDVLEAVRTDSKAAEEAAVILKAVTGRTTWVEERVVSAG